ncbi:MAG TPA: DNA polymerase, partial [Pseudothermotoga sp.]
NFNVRLPSTTGSLSLRIFLTKFVNDDLLVSGYDSFFRNSYYGGRCEVIESRGESVFARCYDFNSLYPTVMRYGNYPDPSSLVYEAFPTIDLIHEFEGVSECTVYVPDMKIPPLPVKFDGKLIFPVGLIRGWWNHNELRLAVKYGVRIEKIHKTVYATRTVTPFIHFVDYFYKLRKVYKAEGHNSESLFCKLILNSLYGKFGQMNEKRIFGWVDEEKGEGWEFEPFGDSDFGVWKKVGEDGRAVKEDARHSVLCWASYITSWARIYLYRKMMEVIEKGGRVFYCDTDSVFTDIELETGNELGQVKLEYQGWFKAYAPKVYQVNLDDHHKIIKVKGVRKPNEIRSRYTEIRVIRPLEALRGNKEAGKPVERVKLLSLLDEKRDWSNGGKPLNYLDLLINKEMRNFKKKEVIKGQRNNLIEVGGQIHRIKTRVEVDQDLEYLYNIIREDIIMRLRGDVDESAR